MDFGSLLEIVGDEPVFETGLLLSGDVSPSDVRRQLSRWTSAGWLHQLRRGVYALAPPYQKAKPHPFLVANVMVRGSYVSLQSALAYHGMIPEHTPLVTSVSTGRTRRWETVLGAYEYRHLKVEWLHGYQLLEVAHRQSAFVALPEKALLDLIYLQPGGDSPEYLAELRLQGLQRLNLDSLGRLVGESGRPKLRRAARHIHSLARAEANEVEGL